MNNNEVMNPFAGKNVPEALAESNQQKLTEALKWLGERHVLKTFISKLDKPMTFVLGGK